MVSVLSINKFLTLKLTITVLVVLVANYLIVIFYTKSSANVPASGKLTEMDIEFDTRRVVLTTHGNLSNNAVISKEIRVGNIKPEYLALDPDISITQRANTTPSNVTHPPLASRDRKRLILAWTPLHSRKPLWGIKPWSFRHCAYKNCEMSGNRSRLNEADLLIFRVRELKKNETASPYRPYVHPIDLSDMPSHHRPYQLWLDINEVCIYVLQLSTMRLIF